MGLAGQNIETRGCWLGLEIVAESILLLSLSKLGLGLVVIMIITFTARQPGLGKI